MCLSASINLFNLFRIMSSNKKDEYVIYEDNYCKLTKTTLTIKWYYFPTAQNKHIKVENIKGLYYKERVRFEDMFKIKEWGMSFSPCWWACDLCRGFGTSDYFNIVLDVENSIIMCGFTVADKNAFLVNIQKLLKSGCRVEHGLPF